MIVRFNSRGKGGGSGPADYLMGQGRDREGATVLRGDLEQTKAVIDSLNFARNYTSGCLSFAEDNIPDHQKSDLMNSFESTVFAGLDRDQYEITWIEHTDKGRLELNYLIANVDLQSGKRYQPYYDKVERPVIDSWQTIVNDHYDYADPNAPDRAAALTQSRNLPRDKVEAKMVITNGLLAMAESGLVTNRQDVVNALTRHGFEVTRLSQKSISIKSPGGGQNIRLKGGIYERHFKHGQELRNQIEARSREYKTGREQRIREAQQVYRAASERKRAYNTGRYSRYTEAARPNKQKDTFSNDNSNAIASSIVGHVSTKGDELHGAENTDNIGRLQISSLRTDNNAQQHRILPTGVDINDRVRATINNSVRQATDLIQLAIQRVERQTHAISEHWRSQSKQEQEHTRIVSESRERQGLSGVQARQIHPNQTKPSDQKPTGMDF